MFIGNSRYKEGEIPTSSLADIVFLLLIFFLVTTSIDIEKGISLRLPEYPDKDAIVPHLSNVLINEAGQVALDGEVITLAELKAKVREKLQSSPQLVISLKTDANTEYNMYLKVLDRLKQAWGNQPTRISIARPFDE